MAAKTHYIKLYYYKGDFDFAGVEITEDRYIIINHKGIDERGEHFTESEAKEICESLNKN